MDASVELPLEIYIEVLYISFSMLDDLKTCDKDGLHT